MNTLAPRQLYQLLPAIYRQRAIYRDTDPDPGELEHLMTIVESALEVLETDITDLYENWFIETCDDWVVPYIGDLLGIEDIKARSSLSNPALQGEIYGQQESRAYVANTLSYRRRKGTAPVLEQLIRDVTSWRARVVEFFDALAIAQNLSHLRFGNTTVNLKTPNQLKLLGSPFEQKVAYSADLRQGTLGQGKYQGKYNVSNIGLFLWRLQSYPITRGTAQAVERSDQKLRGRCYTFSPLLDIPALPLLNPPQVETDITHLAAEINVPGLLRTDPGFEGYEGEHYRGEHPALQIFINGQSRAIPPREVLITQLHPDNQSEQWKFPTLSDQPEVNPEMPQPTKVVAVDPEAGRMVFLDQTPPERVEVSYSYGFSADIGGGPYNRSDAIAQIPPEALPQLSDPFFPPLYWEVEQARSGSANPLAEAVQTWNGTVTAWKAYLDRTFIPLARIEIAKPLTETSSPPVTRASSQSEERRSYQFGIMNGLETIADVGDTQVLITPGLAFDQQGRPIQLDDNAIISLDQHLPRLPSDHPLLVVLSYRADPQAPGCQLHVIPEHQAEFYPEDIYLRLSSIVLDITGNIKTIIRTAPYRTSEVKAGIVAGFNIITPPDVLEAIVQPGVAVDKLGQVITLDRNIPLDLRQYQGKRICLAIAYAETDSGYNWQLHILSDQEAQDQTRYPSDVYIRLAKLTVHQIQITQLDMPTSLHPRFVAGVVQGLNVKGEVGDRKVTITAGWALDAEGRAIVLDRDYQFKLRGFGLTPTKVILAIAYRPSVAAPQWELKLLQDQPNSQSPTPDPYLKLAKLEIGFMGRLEAKPVSLSTRFQPGIVQPGLRVEIGSAPHKIRVTAGKAIDQAGQLITLSAPCTLDLSKHPGRAFVLFISHQVGQGWKALKDEDVETDEIGQSWQHLGIVPEAPLRPLSSSRSSNSQSNNGQMIHSGTMALQNGNPGVSSRQLNDQPDAQVTQTGVILIKDNHTYVGDLDIVIPACKTLQLKLQILAASGCRPHIRGNVSVQGVMDAASRRSPAFEPGECLVDGLLLEGKLTVRAGDLQHLSLRHCTLVPKPTWGLSVESAPYTPIQDSSLDSNSDSPPADEDEEDGGFLFLLVSFFCLVPQLLQLSFNSRYLSSQQRLHQLTHYITTEFEKLWCVLQEEFYQCQQSDFNSPDAQAERFWNWLCCESKQESFNGENADLNIEIDRSIVGSIFLSNSVPHLTIKNSIVDRGLSILKDNKSLSSVAIAAPGTKVNIQQSTIFGTTQVRTLEASTSIFSDAVLVLDRQVGCTRFCYVPAGSQTSPRYRCQPDLALQELPDLPAAITAFTAPTGQQPLLGTAGQGIFRLETHSSSSPDSWIIDLKDQFITALAGYQRDYRSDGSVVYFAGMIGSKLLRSIGKSTDGKSRDWRPIDLQSITTDVTTLLMHNQPLNGTIASQGTTVTGVGTAFLVELQPGDQITVLIHHQEETRTVLDIKSSESLTIDRAFTPDLQTQTPFRSRFLLVGTASDGVWRFTEPEDVWTPMQGLEAYSITSLAIDAKHRIFASTTSGIFRWSAKRKSWRPINQGLTDQQVTALVVGNSDRLFASTATGLVFRSLDRGRHWTSVSNGLPCSKITSLAVQTIHASGHIKGNMLEVVEEDANQLRIGSAITIGNQTRVVQEIQKTRIILDGEFCPAVSGETKFDSAYLFAGTTVNGIFRSLNQGNSWEPMPFSSINQQITVLAVEQKTNDMIQSTIWAGTAIGGVWRSQHYGEQWEPMNQGLKDVDNVVSILQQVQPSFTTTHYGQPAYAQLNHPWSQAIREGAEDGSEMGVFNLLKQSQREQNLQALLDEYLRFGLKPRFFYMT